MSVPPRPLILAHRGLHGRLPENSLPALEAARQVGCDGVEFDVRLLADGTPVLHHDPHLRRRGRRAFLGRMDLPTLRESGKHGRSVATLEAVAQWAALHPTVWLDIELKEPVPLRQLGPLFDRAQPDRSFVTSFDHGLIENLRARRPSWRVGAIAVDWDARSLQRLEEADVDLLILHRAEATTRALDAAQAHGLEVWTWGVQRARQADRLHKLGVAGFITDTPQHLLAWAQGEHTIR